LENRSQSRKSCSRCGREFDEHVVFCSGDGTLLDAFDTDSLSGQVLDDRYRLESKLGEGAHGVVFRATQLGIERTVAVKVLHPAKVLHPSILATVDDARDYWLSCVVRFQREARAAGRLRHPSIVAVTDFGHAPGDVVYMVMEYLSGLPLRHIVRDHAPLALSFIVRIMHQVCWAVEAAHRAGVIHRDLKPSNIVVETVEGYGEVAKVLDFGIAKLTAAADDEITNLTDTGVFLGTPKYMSPEQCGGSPLDVRTDVYSLGVVVYEMLTGALPFSGTAMAVALQHTTTPPRAPRELVPSIPIEIERVVLRALAKDPAARQQSAVELLAELEEAAAGVGVVLTSGDFAPLGAGVGFDDTSSLRLPPPQRSRIEIPIGSARPEPDPDPTPGVPKPRETTVETRARPQLPTPPAGMVLVPAGPFTMGCDHGNENERPAHEVWLDHFFIDATEVTNAQYRLFCHKTGHPLPPNPRWDSSYFADKPNHPVVNVTWADATKYAVWAGKRLPTEAEWEKAARGGLESCDYPWGNEIDPSLAHYDAAGTCPVGTFRSNAYGLYEIVGNVWEWCADWYAADAYTAGPRERPKGPASGADKVLRGGSIDGTSNALRISYRHWMHPARRSSDIGFRCAKDAAGG
jgi:formylglycine-generating enzyme required for sulfatase activity/tRNA A-37 threonylcarbamoyl transferase component Bud32